VKPDSSFRRTSLARERVLYHARFHWRSLVLPTLLLAVVLGGYVALVKLAANAPHVTRYAVLAVVALAGLRLAGRILGWRSRSVMITTHRLIYKQGVLRRMRHEVMLDSLRAVQSENSLLERMLGGGGITLQLADDQVFGPLIGLHRPQAAEHALHQAMARYGRFTSNDTEVLDASEPDPFVLEDLFKQGVITKAEFEAMQSGPPPA
jgi:uncharacterized membrane protein YdbT with pleckstrin-like domain